jgi:hypothetical protein
MSQSTASRFMVSDAVGMGTPLHMSFLECSLDSQRQFGRSEGHRGTRQRSACRARILSDMSGGNLSGHFNETELDWLLPRAIGTTGASPFIPGESLAAWYALVDKVAAIYQYKVRTTSFEVSGQETQYLNWLFNLAGEAQITWGAAWPVVSPLAPSCGDAATFGDVVFTYDSVAYPIQSFRLNVDNAVDTQQYENSITPTRFESQDLIVTLDVQCAFRSDTINLHRAALAGAVASLAIPVGAVTYTFHFGNLKIPNGGPTVPRTGRINQSLSMEAYRVAGTGVTAADNQLRIVKA